MTPEAPKKPGRPKSILGPKAVAYEVAQRKLARAQKRWDDYQERGAGIKATLEAAQAEFDTAKAAFAAELDSVGNE